MEVGFTGTSYQGECLHTPMTPGLDLLAGTYLLLDSTDGATSEEARLRSPLLSSSKQYGCLSFYYHM